MEFMTAHVQRVRIMKLNDFPVLLNVLRHSQLYSLLERLQTYTALHFINATMSTDNSCRIY